MNRTKIEWCDFSWNPVVGCCRDCWYCYYMRMAKRFHWNTKPTFHPERLMEPWNHTKPSKIFVCSIADLFAPWTDKVWRDAVIRSAWLCPVPHTFQFLTKDPELIPNLLYPKNFWMGTTVTLAVPETLRVAETFRFPTKNPELNPNVLYPELSANKDWVNVGHIKKVYCGVRFVSFEPLLGLLPDNVSLEGVDWIIIGKLTGSRKVHLQEAWVWRILAEAFKYGIPVFMKNNLKPEYSGRLIQEFPQPHPGGKAE